MPPNKHGRKQRARGKNTSNIARERTVLTLVEDPTLAPYLLPSQTSYTPATLGNMFNQYHQGQQSQQSGVSVPEVTGFQYQQQQQPGVAPGFGGQGSAYLNQMQPTFQSSGDRQQQPPPQQQQQQSSSGEVSDIEILRKLKQTILSGQHPFFQAVPKPEALATLYLGAHPLSQAQNQKQSDQLGSLSQAQSDKASPGIQKADNVSQVGSAPAAKRPQTPNTTSGSRVLGSLATPQSTPGTFNQSGSHQVQKTANGSVGSARIDHSTGRHHHNDTVPPRSHDFRTSTPSPLPPNSVKSSAPFPPQKYQRGSLSSSASGATHEQSRVPPPSATASAMHDNKPPAATSAKDTLVYKDTHPDAPSPEGLDRDTERDHDRERPGYLPYDSPRYSPTDRRDSGRYPQRYPDSRYDRDREWVRGRDGDGDRDRERDRERERFRDRFEYERSSRPPLDRRPRPPPSTSSSSASIDQKLAVAPDQRSSLGLGAPSEPRRSETPRHSEQRPRPEVPVHPEQRRPDFPVHPEQRRSEIPVHPEQRHPEFPMHPEQRRPEVPAHPEQRRPEVPVHPDHQRRSDVPPHPEQRPVEIAPSHPDQNSRRTEPNANRPALAALSSERRPEPAFSDMSHDRDRLHPAQVPPYPRPGPPGTAPPNPIRRSQHPATVTSPVDDHKNPDPSGQSVSSGNKVSRPGHVSPEVTRRPDPVSSTVGYPSTGVSVDNNALRSVSDRRPTHPADPQLPQQHPMSEFRAGQGQRQDDHVNGPQPSHPSATPSAAPHSVSRVPSPGPRRPTESSYDASRERDRAPSMSAPSYREPILPPNADPSRSYPEDSRRQSLEPNVPRRVSDNFYPRPPSAASSVTERREEIRQWREREGYTPISYAASEADRERTRRYNETREWHEDAYGRERDLRVPDADVHPPRPPPPAPSSWNRERSIDKDKDGDGYEGWVGAEKKFPARGVSPPPTPSRWEEPVIHPHRPLHTRLTDTYDDRFIPREVAERARYPGEILDYRENPRVRPRSPSASRRPGIYDDAHRAPKRAREEYEAPSRVPYDYPPPPQVPAPSPYYDPRASVISRPRAPSPYDRDRVPDPYARRDMPPPRSPPYYARERYEPR